MIPGFGAVAPRGAPARTPRARLPLSPGLHGVELEPPLGDARGQVEQRGARASRRRRDRGPTPGSRWSVVGAGIAAERARSSATVPNGSVVPWTKSAGVRRRGKCATRSSRGPARRMQGIGEEEERSRQARARPRRGGSPGGRRTNGRPVRRAADRARAERRARRPGARRDPARRRPATAAHAAEPGETADRSGAPRRPGCQRVGERDEERAVRGRAGAVGEDEALRRGAAPRGVERARGRPAHRRPPRGTGRGRRRGSGCAHRCRRRPGARWPRARRGDSVTVVVFFDVAGTLIRVRDGVGVAVRAGRGALRASSPTRRRSSGSSPGRSAPRRAMAFPGAPAEAVPGTRARGLARHRARRLRGRRAPRRGFAPGAFDAYFDAVYRHFEDAGHVGRLPRRGAGARRAPRARLRRSASSATSTAASCGSSTGSTSRRWFASVTLSSQVGATKPDRAIFARALAHHGVDAARAIHVGDSPGRGRRRRARRGPACRPDRPGRASRGPSRARARGARSSALAEVIRNTG